MGKFGLQLYSVKEAAEKDFLGTVNRVAEMGYSGVQFAGFFNTPAKELKKVMDDKGIVAAGSHTSLDLLRGDQLEETLEYNHKIENNLIICPYLPEEFRNTGDDYKKTAEMFNEIGQKCKQNGFVFAYHNHAFEFERFNGKSGFDLLFENCDPDLVKVELDCYWATFAGLEPAKLIKKYGERVVSLHIKDMGRKNGQQRSIEIGKGVLNIKGFIQAGEKYDTKWFIVEQEQFDSDPMESAKTNIKNLIDLVGVN